MNTHLRNIEFQNIGRFKHTPKYYRTDAVTKDRNKTKKPNLAHSSGLTTYLKRGR